MKKYLAVPNCSWPLSSYFLHFSRKILILTAASYILNNQKYLIQLANLLCCPLSSHKSQLVDTCPDRVTNDKAYNLILYRRYYFIDSPPLIRIFGLAPYDCEAFQNVDNIIDSTSFNCQFLSALIQVQ
jgi:hypothetical protein